MTKIKPLGNRVLVKRSKANTSQGGILLPDSAQEKPREGEIVAAGPGKRDEDGKLHALTVKEGDRVLFGAYAGTEVSNIDGQTDDDEFLVMAEDEILGTLA